ncbi:MAG TPA: phosphoribosylpyrophosphate synthetase [Maribacter sp.]|uniref:phosphoribosylpyrophosphate synthetase n=1 Tax=unclassified Maribacter TaxID=2615042 RepID=UPI000ECA06DD|nr:MULTISPECIES: phosphoribosylpyrophosphate synthetase [unclassified Maribacter]HAF79089.1 phosphoribosylpyrophosphate synthetase [Maribacter sp.]HAI41343.1 phosphoribosylpyrophosphate synthetase [Maribacter sp.]|tara:strand:- start:869 stop:1162 length:294 start_codon:yes stop_codon:yes gene_type:complete
MEETLIDILKEVNKLGYSKDFNRSPWKEKLKLNTADFTIDQMYRFDGMTDPEDEAILFTISSVNLNLKGYLLNGYGIYSEEWINNVVTKLKTQKKEA